MSEDDDAKEEQPNFHDAVINLKNLLIKELRIDKLVDKIAKILN
jgi:hypothetical protein